MPELIISRVCWRGSAGYLAARAAGENISVFAGGLRSGRGPFGAPLSDYDLTCEFDKHCHLWKERHFCPSRATALVSGSDRIIDTLHRAFQLCHTMMEEPEHVHIIFLCIPENWQGNMHSAKKLADRSSTYDAGKFKHEFLFEWCFPTKFVIHFVTLKTLMDRGLSIEPLSHTKFLKAAMLEKIGRDTDCGWEVGLSLGCIAKAFGANSPCIWVAERLMLDLYGPRSHLEDGQFCDSDRTADFFSAVKDGIDTYLIDWWMLSTDFDVAMREYKLWREIYENMAIQEAEDMYHCWNSHEPKSAGLLAQSTYTAEVKRVEESVTFEGIRLGF